MKGDLLLHDSYICWFTKFFYIHDLHFFPNSTGPWMSSIALPTILFSLRWLFEGFISAIIHLQTPNTHHHQLCTSIITLSNWAAQMHSGNRWIFVCMEKKIIYDMMDDYLTELWWMITLQNYQTFKDSKILSSLASNFCGFNIINLILLPLEFVLN